MAALSASSAPFLSARATSAPILPSPGAELACKYDAMTPEGHTNLQQHWSAVARSLLQMQSTGLHSMRPEVPSALTEQDCARVTGRCRLRRYGLPAAFP